MLVVGMGRGPTLLVHGELMSGENRLFLSSVDRVPMAEADVVEAEAEAEVDIQLIHDS